MTAAESGLAQRTTLVNPHDQRQMTAALWLLYYPHAPDNPGFLTVLALPHAWCLALLLCVSPAGANA